MKIKLLRIILLPLLIASTGAGQTGGSFNIGKSVIASGGGTSSGGAFVVEGTAGQPAAGIIQGSPFSISAGFVSPSLTPTAATVAVSGRVLTPSGRGLMNAVVLLTNANGGTRSVRTGTFGYYHFVDVEAGQTCVFSIRSKRFQFSPQAVMVFEEVNGLDFTALP